MKWIGQHIYDLISRFRNTVYFESNVNFNTDTVTFESANTDDPQVIIKNTTNDDQGCQLILNKLRADDAVATGQNLGEIHFTGQDSAQNSQTYSYIISEIDVSTHGQESGKLNIGVCSHNGTNQPGIILTGGSVAGEVDATIGRGAASVTNIAGSLRPVGQIHMTHHNFSDDIDTTKHYVGLARGDSENTATTQIHTPLVFPTAAKLLKIYLRANQNLSTKEITFTLETQAAGVTFGTGPTIIGTLATSGPTNSSIVTYDFTSPDSGDNIVDAGDAAYLGIQSSASTSTTKFYITCIWEIDFSSI
tara:strand:- start:534 stop:1448 length:915 start_codon:yes stop_codon:yes gene_type:complete